MDKKSEKIKKKVNKKKIILSIVLAISFVLVFIGGYFSRYILDRRSATVSSEIVNIIDKVGFVIDPETGKPIEFTEKDFADAIINGLLDDYSSYYTKEEYKKILSESKGRYDGGGIGFYDTDLKVDKIIGNSPADLSGMKSGDEIVAGQKNGGERKEFNDVYDVLRFLNDYDDGDTITLFVNRLDIGEELNFSIKKTAFLASYVSYYDSENAYLFRTDAKGKLSPIEFKGKGMPELDKDTAYVLFDTFEGDAAKQLQTVLGYMQQRGRNKLILDLRNNGGGYMNVLVDVASLLVYNGGQNKTVVAYTQGKDGFEEFSTFKNSYCSFIKSISVIANKNTASASECLIGAMLYYGDGFSIDRLIVEKDESGEARTYGKGIMQTTYRLISGGAFKLTTARVLWPDKSTCIHGKGITPTENNSATRENAILRAMETLS